MYLVKQAIELNNEVLNLYLMDYNHMLRIVTHGLMEEMNCRDELNNFSKSLTLSSEQQKDPLWVKSYEKFQSFIHQKTNINKSEMFLEFLDSLKHKTNGYIFMLSENNSKTDEGAYNIIMDLSKELNVYIDTLKNLLLKKGSEKEILKCIDTF